MEKWPHARQESTPGLSMTFNVRDPDAFIVRRALDGDTEATTELYRRHERRAYNLALRTLGNSWDAADVTQEAFIKAFRNLASFKGESLFSTWLHRIVVNAAYDHLRRQRPEPMDMGVMDDISGPAGSATIVGSGKNGIEPAMDGLSDPLRNALMSLNEGFRFAVVLCDLLGFPYAEAAEILGVQEGTIKSRIFRARETLAATLHEAGYELPGGRNQTRGKGVTPLGANGDEDEPSGR
jgi:RNA polymerase sigma-70 factor (ECF subfamily)